VPLHAAKALQRQNPLAPISHFFFAEFMPNLLIFSLIFASTGVSTKKLMA
jgi:hypothetical protein